MRPKRALSIVPERRAELETCGFCPKLCRAACPVSDAEASETVTPWGQMSAVFAVGRGVVPENAGFAELPWACTGCLACRERCDHKNPVPATLFDARAEYAARGLAPEAAERVITRHTLRMQRIERRLTSLKHTYQHRAGAATALLLGCEYVSSMPRETDDALRVARALFGPLRLVGGCCGYPLEAAGDRQGAEHSRNALLAEVGTAQRFIVVDSGCANRLAGTSAEPLCSAALAALPGRARRSERFTDQPLRYHDACSLGRGLGEYDAPRELVARAAGAQAAEFFRSREAARCSGGGGLLPVVRPRTAQGIARDRVREHIQLGGGRIVTACAQSLKSFRAMGAEAVDLSTIVQSLIES